MLTGQGRDRPAEFEQVSGNDRADVLDQLFGDGVPVARWAQLRERHVTKKHGPVSEL